MRYRKLSALLVAVAMVVAVLIWLQVIRVQPPYKGVLDNIRDVLLSALQIVGMTALLGIIIVICRWLSREGEGTVILPFDYPKTDTRCDGKAISDSLKTELLRIFQIHRQDIVSPPTRTFAARLKDFFSNVPKQLPFFQPEDVLLQTSFREASRAGIGPSRSAIGEKPSISAKARPKDETRLNTSLVPTGDNLNPNFADVATVGIGGTTVSVGRLLITIKQLWALRDPNFVISGSLQRFGSVVRLVAFRESKNKQIDTWEVSSTINKEDEIPSVIKDLAFKIWQGISTSDANTWEGFKHFTEALDGYRQYTLNGRDEELEKVCTSCLLATNAEKNFKATFDLLYNVALAYFNKGEYGRAQALCHQAIAAKDGPSLDGDSEVQLSDAFNLLGSTFAQQKEPQDAEYAYRRAIKRNPRNLDAYVNLTHTLAPLGLDNEVRALINKATSLNLLASELPCALGDWYASVNLTNEAIECYSKVLASNPKEIYSRYRLGSLYADLQRTPEAVAELKQAIITSNEAQIADDNLAFICNELGVIYASQKKTDDAIALYNRAIELNPEFAYPHNNLGLIYADSGKSNEAIAEYSRAIYLDSKLTAAYLNLAGTYTNLNWIEEAISVYKAAIEIDPKDAQAHDWLGGLYAVLGRSSEAIQEFKLALASDPTNANTYQGLAYAYRDCGKYDEAIDAYKRSLELSPNSPESYTGMGGVYRRLGRCQDAIEAYQTALRLGAYPLAVASMAACYRTLGFEKEYSAHVHTAMGLPHDWTGDEYNHACFLALCGKVDEALDKLEVALEERQQTAGYADRDIDFDFIRENPRFKKLIQDYSPNEVVVEQI